MPDVTFLCPDLTTFARPDELDLQVVGQRLKPDRAVLAQGRRLRSGPRNGAPATRP